MLSDVEPVELDEEVDETVVDETVVDAPVDDDPVVDDPPVEAELPEVFVPLDDDVLVDPLVPVPKDPLDCDFFSLATSALRFSLEDSSINPKRSVVPVGSTSLGATRLKRARPRGLSDSRSVTPP